MVSSQRWQRLDNAAKIFPAVTGPRLTHLFRLATNFDHPVDSQALTRALHAVWPRFPSFGVRLRPGLFWYSLVEESSVPRIFPESTSPQLAFQKKYRTPHLVRVRCFESRLAVEFSHVVTDGVGALVFLKALTAEYLHQVGVEVDPSLRRLGHRPDPGEDSDDFQSLYDPGFPRYKTWDRAYLPTWPLLPKGQYAVTTGRMAASEVLGRARDAGATLTEYLSATLLAAFQDTFLALPPGARRRRARPLRLVLPVNLRPVFGSRTLRNFFIVVPVEIDLRLGEYTFEEILRNVHHQLQAEMDPKLLRKQIVRNLRGELNPLARLLPLPVKKLVLTSVFGSYERRHTASLSNLGRAPGLPGVRSLDFSPPPSPFCRVNVGVVTVGDTLSVTFGNTSVNPGVERAFFTRLRAQGLGVFVESNRPLLEV